MASEGSHSVAVVSIVKESQIMSATAVAEPEVSDYSIEALEPEPIENGISTVSIKSFEKGVQDRKKLMEMSPPPYAFQHFNKELTNAVTVE